MSDSSPRHSTIVDPRVVQLQRLRRLSFYLDNAIVIPIINYRIGLDPIIGLLPGGGDAAGLFLSSYIVLESARLGASKSVLGQMAFNILLETFAGTVPVLGDLFDATWKSNARNIQLLEDHLKIPQPQRQRNQAFAILLIVGLVLVFIGCLALSILLLRWLLQFVNS
ncbi:MAG: DUF4112 domain-containing protein [Cyanobacteria bacterium CRU_2_1]|nr:DUF4112 domain-containing protein [Cyanobacteria bacterium RU_5_0]NJR61283.1 DUF4112 domain-containing protein [Cyanobacteria bacterium CRU_2_1]